MHKNSFAAFALTILLFALSNPPSMAEIELPQMGDSSGSIISPLEEKALGEAFMRELRRSASIVDDPETIEYIQSLGYKIVSQTQAPLDFTFFVVESPVINAFAAPGGYIGLHSQLILETQTESELASVVAHEVAHITQRHLPRAFEQASKMNIPAAAALIAAIVLAGSNPDIAHAAIATTLAGTQQSMINFTRSNEKEADNIGMQYLANSEFDPQGMPDFFARLHKAHRYYDSKLPEYLSTHPVTLSRIAESQSRAEQLKSTHTTTQQASFYPLLKAKLRVATDSTGHTSLQYYEQAIIDTPAEASNYYGLSLALLKTRQLDKALEQATKLHQSQPETTAYIHLLANIYLERKQPLEATSLLSKALKIYPRHYPLTMLQAQALLDNQQAMEARRLLLDLIYYREPTPALYTLFAKASAQAGYISEAHEALAESHYQQGAIAAAIDQINSALKHSDAQNLHLQARLEARKKELSNELKLRSQEN